MGLEHWVCELSLNAPDLRMVRTPARNYVRGEVAGCVSVRVRQRGVGRLSWAKAREDGGEKPDPSAPLGRTARALLGRTSECKQRWGVWVYELCNQRRVLGF